MSAADTQNDDRENDDTLAQSQQASSFEDAATLPSNNTLGSSPTLTDESILEHTPTQNTILDATLPMGQGAQPFDGDDHYGIKPSNKEQRFEIFREINRGGMGAILESRDVNLRRDVAMKVILAKDATDQEVRRFVEEAQITGQLEHPSIVPVHELSVDADGKIFYTMKMVHGETLKDILKNIAEGDQESITKYSLSMLLDIFNRVCDAISFAHSRGIIHRDLKPENIMIGDFGEVQVMDWGLAKILGKEEVSSKVQSTRIQSVRTDSLDQTMDGQILGTPQFMAPEQARGDIDQLCPQTDVYALGAILYQILTLRPPISGKSVHDLLDKVVKGEITPPTQYNTTTVSRKKEQAQAVKEETRRIAKQREIALRHCPNNIIPVSLSAVCMRAMQNKIEKRYQDVGALQKDIRSYMDGFATEAEGAGSFRQLMLLYKRHRSEFTLVGVGLIVAVLMITIFINNLQKSEAAAQKARGEAEQANILAQAEKNKAIQSEQQARDERLIAEQQRQEASYSLYRMSIREVDRLIRNGYMPEAQKQIALINKELRGWEYEYLDGRINRNEYFEFIKPKGAGWFGTSMLSLSKDGKRLVSGSWGGYRNISLWDMETGEHVCTNSVPFLTDDFGRTSVHDLCFSPDGQSIVMGGLNDEIVVCKANITELITNFEAHEGTVSSVQYDPTGKFIVSGSYDKTIKLWDAQTFKLMRTYTGHTDRVFSVKFSLDGKRFLSSGADGTIIEWDKKTGDRIHIYRGHTEDVRMAVYAPDDVHFASAGWDNTIKIWNTQSKALVHTLEGHTDRVECVDFAPDGFRLASGSGDASVKIWDWKRGKELVTKYGNDNGVMSVLFTPDGNNLVSGGATNTIKVWDLGFQRNVVNIQKSEQSGYSACIMDLARNGKHIAIRHKENDIAIYDANSGALQEILDGPGDSIVSMRYFNDDQRLAVGRFDGVVDIWDLKNKTIIKSLKKFGMSSVHYISVAPNNKYAVFGHGARGFLIWDLEKGVIAADWGLKRANIDYIHFLNDSSSISFSDRSVATVICDAMSGKIIRTFEQEADVWSHLVFSPDERIAVGLVAQNRMGIWDVQTGKIIKRFNVKTAYYKFTPDGTRLIVSNYGKDISVWDTRTWEKLLDLDYDGRPVTGVFISADGKKLVTHSTVGRVQVHFADNNRQREMDPGIVQLQQSARTLKERYEKGGLIIERPHQGFDYYDGIGVTKNYKKALLLFKEEVRGAKHAEYVEYIVMRIWLCRMHLGQVDVAKKEVGAFLGKSKISGWSRFILEFMHGDISGDKLLSLVTTRDETTKLQQLCEAYYYIGSAERFAGNSEKAKEYFKKCIGTGVKDFTEYRSSAIELKEMK